MIVASQTNSFVNSLRRVISACYLFLNVDEASDELGNDQGSQSL